MYNRPQKLGAEFVGTFALIFFGAGSICADQFLHSSGQGGVGLLGIALAHGLAIGIMVTSLGHISGGHFNPAVTIGFWVTRKLSTMDTLAFWVAQLAGAAAAAYLLRLLPFDVWSAVQLGTPALASGISRASGMIFEGIMTFFLVFVVFATAVDPRGAFNKVAGFAIGLTITAAAIERVLDGIWLVAAFWIAASLMSMPRALVDFERALAVGVLVLSILFLYILFRKKHAHSVLSGWNWGRKFLHVLDQIHQDHAIDAAQMPFRHGAVKSRLRERPPDVEN